MDDRRRRELTRFGAPVAFLAAVTVAVLLIKSALSGGSSTTVALTTSTMQVTTHPRRTRTTVKTTTTNSARYYTIQPGDTLGSVAIRERTTVDELMRLNPGIDPHALHTGQRIRVG